MPISPMPRAPTGLKFVSFSSQKLTSMMPMSALSGPGSSARFAFTMRPSRGSSSVSSKSAMLTPQTRPPMSWLRASFAFMSRPTLYAATIRGTRMTPRSSSTRTSQNTAPNERVPKFFAASVSCACACASITSFGRPAAHAARLARALRPAEAAGRVGIALPQHLARPGSSGVRLLLGIVGEAQLERVHAEGGGELVHRRLDRERAARLAGRSLERGRADVKLREAVARRHVVAGVEVPSRARRRLGEVLDEGGGRDDIVADRQQPAALLRAERDALLGARPPAHRPEHLRPRERDFHRTGDTLRGHRGERYVRPRRALAAEAAADEGRHDAHALGLDAERLGDP